jgi:Family of unknown function (DUF6107)
MTDWTTTLTDWSARGAGAVAGSSVSLIYLLPKQRHQAASRLVVGIICGLVFGQAAGEKLVQFMALEVHPKEFEVVLMGAAAASFASWWSLGFLVRLIEKSASAPDKKSRKPPVEPAITKDGSQ